MPGLLRSLFHAAVFAGAISVSALAPVSLAAQEHAAPAAAAQNVDFITPHITDSHHLEIPYWKAPFHKEIELPHWEPIHVGPLTVDMSPTKHVVFMLLAALLSMIMLIGAASSSTAGHKMIGRPKGFTAAIEALALTLRNEVILPNVGHHGEKYVPFALTLFFFILFCNLLGLMPYGATPTGNISVTATLAIVTFLVVELTGIFTLKGSYVFTFIYWNKELPLGVRIPMLFLMSPIELIGKIIKPIALAIRLFANMTAGHIVLLAIIGLIFTFGSWAIAGGPVLMAVAISVLELFVSFLQAFIFTLLASVFIGQMRELHH
ncbi:MAG: F0F1 ATP synthase subunit A [Phycisphaerae bacterium]|nr:F0F1 ATP synthase subunit A [Gemmatimonadaceae bacterium]